MQLPVPCRWLPALAIAVGVAGCASTVSGVAVRAGNGVGSDGVDTAQLDPGSYPTRPAAPFGTAGSAAAGAIIEAHRMADNVVVPSEIDGTLTKPSWFNTGTLATSDAVAVDLPAPGPEIAAAHHLLLGFSSCRTTAGPGDKTILINTVLRFPDAATATAAATELATKVAPPVPGQPMPIPEYPAAQATAAATDGFHAVVSFLPHGPYVLYQYAQSPRGADAAARLVADTLRVQIPRVDAFTPTDPAGFADLSIDPDGLLNRVVPTDTRNRNQSNVGRYQPRAALHFEADPKAPALYAAGGVDAVGMSRTTVYRARDAAGADRMVAMAADDTAAEPGAKPADGVPGLTTAKCFDIGSIDRDQSRFRCFARADRYMFRGESSQLRDAAQQMASQYLMLTG